MRLARFTFVVAMTLVSSGGTAKLPAAPEAGQVVAERLERDNDLRQLYAATLASVRAHDNGGLPQGP